MDGKAALKSVNTYPLKVFFFLWMRDVTLWSSRSQMLSTMFLPRTQACAGWRVRREASSSGATKAAMINLASALPRHIGRRSSGAAAVSPVPSSSLLLGIKTDKEDQKSER